MSIFEGFLLIMGLRELHTKHSWTYLESTIQIFLWHLYVATWQAQKIICKIVIFSFDLRKSNNNAATESHRSGKIKRRPARKDASRLYDDYDCFFFRCRVFFTGAIVIA